MIETTEFVVPKSIPMIFSPDTAMTIYLLSNSFGRRFVAPERDDLLFPSKPAHDDSPGEGASNDRGRNKAGRVPNQQRPECQEVNGTMAC